MSKNHTAEIIRFIMPRERLDQHQFKKVTQKEFWAALSLIQTPLRVDYRLSESHDLINYYVPNDLLDQWRKHGMKTPQIAYISKGDYLLHEWLADHTYLIPSLNIKTVDDLKKSLPELLEILSDNPRPQKKRYNVNDLLTNNDQPTPPRAA